MRMMRYTVSFMVCFDTMNGRFFRYLPKLLNDRLVRLPTRFRSFSSSAVDVIHSAPALNSLVAGRK